MSGPRILLVVGGGIAAYKACELVRLIRKDEGEVVCVLTAGGAQFVTAMSLAALSENRVHTTLWDLTDEAEMGHIQLSRAADLVVVCPATADLLAKMAAGVADDLATTLLLATDKPVLAVPAMNVRMWEHPATVRNVARLRGDGVHVLEPDEGPMACGEYGAGRLPDPEAIRDEIGRVLASPGAAADGVGPGGLTAGLIPRRMTPALAFDEEAGVPPDGDGNPVHAFDPAHEIEPLPGPAPTPGLDVSASPLLVRKGKAAPAPPTDPAAMPDSRVFADLGEGAAPEPATPAPQPDAEPAPAAAPDEPSPLAGQPDFAEAAHRPLHGRHVLVTAGPTHEPIDPVRYIANRSSGRQGFAIAAAAAAAGARVTLVAGPVSLATPPGVERIDVETAREMADAVARALPADAAVMVAAVADWRSRDTSGEKLKKRGSAPPALILTENPDILATVASGRKRPRLVIGFAAETENVLANARDKLKRKAVDWIVANDVSGSKGESVMGGARNRVHIVTGKGVESWDDLPKEEVATRLVAKMADVLA